MIAPGLRSKCFETSSSILDIEILLVPNVSVDTEIGEATPIAYEICTSAREAIPAATKFLEDRSRGMPVRLTSDIQQAFGKNASFYDEFNAMRSAKTARAKKLYRPAFKVTIPVTNDLKQLLNRPSVISGYERAMNIVKEGGLDDPGFRLVNGKLFKLTAKGNVSKKEIDSIPTDFLHTIKMGLDENLGDATKASFMGQGAATGAGRGQEAQARRAIGAAHLQPGWQGAHANVPEPQVAVNSHLRRVRSRENRGVQARHEHACRDLPKGRVQAQWRQRCCRPEPKHRH